MEGCNRRGSKHREIEEVPIYNSCQENYHQHHGIWNELLIESWKLYVKKKKKKWLGTDGQGMKEEGAGIEEVATKRPAEEGGCVFREGYGDKFSLRKHEY